MTSAGRFVNTAQTDVSLEWLINLDEPTVISFSEKTNLHKIRRKEIKEDIQHLPLNSKYTLIYGRMFLHI